ncbi:MAG: Smr/MutS family protein [Gemmatimonadota bacterium]
MSARLKHLGELAHLREQLAERARAHEREAQAIVARRKRAERSTHDFMQAMDEIGGVQPLEPHGRHVRTPKPHPPHPRQRELDEQQVLESSVSDEIDVDSLLDTDESLSFRRPGIGPETVRKLRRGEWSIQDQLDLHGHRIDEARAALVEFLRDAGKRGLRCVRIVHGKGLGSKDRAPVLKGKVRAWLAQRDEVIAFCQARPAAGGSGALVVLLRPSP